MTSKTLSHTPGPWFITDSDSDSFNIGSDTCGIAFLHDPMMRELGYAEELEANARLIAAAPDLLAALELALSHIGWCWDVIEQNTNLTRGGSAIVHDQIRAAIAKATGEQR